MYYLQSRYYDPVTCRFLSADAYVSTGQGVLGYNMFAYCNNNPVVLADSTGHFPWVIIGVAAVALVLLSGCSKEVEELPYSSADEAAMAFANSTYSSSLYIRHEYSTKIYSRTKDGKTTYNYASPKPGKPHNCNYNGIKTPAGTKVVATAHTHPNSNSFSGISPGSVKGDIPNANRRGIDSYVIGPNLILQKYNVSTGLISVVDVASPVALTNEQKDHLMIEFKASWDGHIGDCDFGCEYMTWPTP